MQLVDLVMATTIQKSGQECRISANDYKGRAVTANLRIQCTLIHLIFGTIFRMLLIRHTMEYLWLGFFLGYIVSHSVCDLAFIR